MGIITSVARSTTFLFLFFEILLSLFKAPVEDEKTSLAANFIGPLPFSESINIASGQQHFFSAFSSYEVSPITVITKDITLELDVNGYVTIAEDAVDNGSNSTNGTVSFDTDITSFDCSEIGEHTVTLTVKDESGASATGTAIVIVRDSTFPTVITNPFTIDLDSTGSAIITTEDIDNGSFDNCQALTLSLDKYNFNCGDIGDNIVLLTVTDAAGNEKSASATVTVQDIEVPTVVTQDIEVVLDALGQASITPDQIDNGSTDNCSVGGLSLDISEFDCSQIGVNTVTLTVTDQKGNPASATAVVTVKDDLLPTVVTKPATIYIDASGVAKLLPEDVDGGSSDNCGIITYSLSKDSFICSEVGDQTVTLTVTDINNNSASAPVIVTVVDEIIPTVITKDITVELNSSGLASVTADQINSGSFDNCGIASLTLDKELFDCSNVGENTVTLTVTDVNGKIGFGTAVVTIEDNIAPIVPEITDILSACTYTVPAPETTDNCGATIVGTTTDPLTYSDPGEYSINWSFNDGNENVSTATQKIVIDPIVPTAQITHITCHGSSTGSVSVTATGGNGPYTFSWSGGLAEGNTKNDLPAGTYIVTVTDTSGCSSELVMEITQPELITMEAPTLSHVGCHGGNDGSITINTSTGGVGKHLYSVNGSAFSTNKVYSGLINGEYTVLIKDEKNCIVSEIITITEPALLSMTDPSSTDVTCFGGNDGTITAGTVSGGIPPYQFTIDNATYQDHGNFTGVAAGRHSVRVVDANGCAFEKQILVDQPGILAASINKTNVKCNGGSDGKIYLTNVSGGSGIYEFSVDGVLWTASTSPIESLVIGTYSVQIRDANYPECVVALGNSTLNQPAPLVANITTTRTTTYGSASGSATANPTGGSGVYSYEWKKTGDADFIQITKTANNLLAGEYSVKVTDSNGCFINVTTIKVVDKVSAEINAISLCEDVTGEGLRTSTFSVDLPTVMGGVGNPEDFKYSWDFGSGIESVILTAEGYKVEYTVGGDKIITLTIEDGNNVITVIQYPHYVGQCFENCGQSNNFKIDTQSFFIGDEAGNPITGDNCSSIVKKYLWFNIVENSNAYALNTEIKYSVNDGDETHKRVVMGCSGKKVEVSSSNGKTNWEYELLPTGKYKLFEVSDSPTTDNSKIQWSCGQTFTIEGLTMRFVTNATKECGDTGNMQCIGVTDNQEVSTPIYATATSEAVKCKGEALGSITFSVKGGIPPYNYSIYGDEDTKYQSSGIFVNLLAGTYDDVWVKDSRGNKYKLPDPVVVEEPLNVLGATTEIVTPILCNGGTAIARVTAAGGTAPYTYLWNDTAETTEEISGLPAGTYTVTVVDANACQVIESITITEPAPLTTAQVGESQHLGCGFNSTFLEANSPVSGTGKWSLEAITPSTIDQELINFVDTDPRTKFSAPEGTYTLRWTIANADGSCANYAEMTVQFDGNCEQLDFDGIDDYIIVGDHYDFSASSFTLEAWVKPEAANGNRTVLSKGNWRAPAAGGYELLINNGAFTFRWNSNSVTTAHKIGTDRWYHLAVIFQNDKVDLYVDGISVATRVVNAPPRDVPEPFLIGGMYDVSKPEKPEGLFHGWIEEVRIWETALTIEQLRFMMNQRIEPVSVDGNTYVKGKILPMNVPGPLSWTKLKGYYRLLAQTELIENGSTPNLASDSAVGYLKNIESFQVNSAPLPYISETDGPWNDRATWDQAIGTDAEKWWIYPNATGINGASIDWNIAFVNDKLSSGNRDITLLALLIGGSLEMEGINPKWANDVLTPGTGNGLTISRYLELNGLIDLDGESQLVQTEGSILEGTGTLERDQQGTASSYNYNYWTSPVSSGTIGNSGYNVAEIMMDGTDPEKALDIDFNYQYHYADSDYYKVGESIRISTYWMNKFFGAAGKYSQWKNVGENGHLSAGEGFSMKGALGFSTLEELQNYTFVGIPNNGTITLHIDQDQGYLIGNPYPSAIDADKFIMDNIKEIGGNNSKNIFNGSLYFWDHFGGQTHYLQEYIGGYAIYNLSGGVKAIANDSRINNETPDGNYRTGHKIPQRYIPVGQAFFVHSILDEAIKSSEIPVTVEGGDLIFRNSQRIFMKEGESSSVFHSPESVLKKEKENIDKRTKIWLKFHSPTGYHRQLLVTADNRATNGFDLGFDAMLTENNAEDMFWYFSETEFVVQGVSHFNKDQVLPLGIKVKKNSEFTIKIDILENIPDATKIYLKDNQLKVLHDLRSSDYKATAEPGTINNRFELVFQAEDTTPGEPDGGGEDGGDTGDGGDEDGGADQGGDGGTPDPDNGGIVPPTGLEIFYVQESRELVIQNPDILEITNAFLTNTLGQKVIEYTNIPEIKETRLPVQDFGVGVYFITINSEKGPLIKKLIIE